MQTPPELQIPIGIVITIIGCLLGVGGSLLLFCGGLIAYVYKRHVSDNDAKFADNRDDHKIIFERLDAKKK